MNKVVYIRLKIKVSFNAGLQGYAYTSVSVCFVRPLVSQAALVIKPAGSNFVKAIGRSIVLTCEDSASTPGSRLVWKDTRNRDVSENSQHR